MGSEDRVVRRIEGYAIVSEDGMLADAARVMPNSLKFDADQRFFESSLDGADVVVHGRHSQEQQPRSHLRYRLVLSRRVAGTARHPTNAKALFWNPAGTTFDAALRALGAPGAAIAVIGGTDVFALFLDLFDVFHLSQASGVHLPGGRPVFPGVPMRTPQEILAEHGLVADAPLMLDRGKDLTLVSWRRNRQTTASEPAWS